MENLRSSLLSVFFILFGSSGFAGGAPYFNLLWFLQDVVVATQIGKERYEWARNLGAREEEMSLRDLAEPTTPWIMRSQGAGRIVGDIDCSAFILRTFAEWQSDTSIDVKSVPQWREAYHGVSVVAEYRSGRRGLTHVRMAAAVVSPGIPEHAFLPGSSGAISTEFFEIAATFRSAGFHRMHEAVSPLEMTLVRQETCRGFDLYTWEFQRSE